MKYSKTSLKLLGPMFFLMLTVSSAIFAAAKGGDSVPPTLFLDLNYNLSSTHKSKFFNSNDTGTGFAYTLGGNAGANRSFGFFIKDETAATTFALVSSKMTTHWQDVVLRYNFYFMYFGVVFDRFELITIADGTNTIDASSNGYGGNLGLSIPISKLGTFFLDVMSTSVSKTYNKEDTAFTASARTDFELGLNYFLYKDYISVCGSYLQRSFTIASASSFKEAMSINHLGFRFAYDF